MTLFWCIFCDEIKNDEMWTSLTGSGWEKHAEGGEQDPQGHHDLQTAGGTVCCPGDHDCPGLLWL